MDEDSEGARAFPAPRSNVELLQEATGLVCFAGVSTVWLAARGIKLLLRAALFVFWCALGLSWPVLRMLLGFLVLLQFLRMLYYWNTPEAGATRTFLEHFGVLALADLFVHCYPCLWRKAHSE